MIVIKVRKKGLLRPISELPAFFYFFFHYNFSESHFSSFQAWKRYFEKYPERIGLDVLYQVAVTNRRSVESYRKYQDNCLQIVDEVNAAFPCKEYPNWKPIKFDMDGVLSVHCFLIFSFLIFLTLIYFTPGVGFF